MTCTLKLAVKLRGTRHMPGAVLDVTDEEYGFLMQQGAVDTAPAPRTTVKVRAPRSEEERAAALAEAQARVANGTAR